MMAHRNLIKMKWREKIYRRRLWPYNIDYKTHPKSIATRLSSLPRSKGIFIEAAEYYEQNLASQGYNEN